MDVKTLYTFIAVVDHGSFAGAAEALGVSLSSISMQMRSLEQDCGMILFDRSRRPPVLTADGYEFSVQAREVIHVWERLSTNLRRASRSGVLKVGAVHTAVAGLLPAAFLRLRERIPELSVRLTTGLTHELEASVRAGRIDVAIVTEPETVSPDSVFRAFCEERLVLIAHERARGSTFREILAANPYVRFSPQARVARLVEANLEQLGVEVVSQMEVDSLEGVISLVAAGLGVSVVPERIGPASFPPQVRCFELDRSSVRRLGLLALCGNARQRFSDELFVALQEGVREWSARREPKNDRPEADGTGTMSSASNAG